MYHLITPLAPIAYYYRPLQKHVRKKCWMLLLTFLFSFYARRITIRNSIQFIHTYLCTQNSQRELKPCIGISVKPPFVYQYNNPCYYRSSIYVMVLLYCNVELPFDHPLQYDDDQYTILFSQDQPFIHMILMHTSYIRFDYQLAWRSLFEQQNNH
jgi:hypothetical protein